MEIKDHFQITPLRTLEHYKKINPNEVSLPRPFSENIKNIESEEEILFFSIIKENNFLEALEQYYNNGDETIRKNILEALSYIKDKDSFLFYLTKIRTNQEYNMYKKSIQKLDIALYCPKLN